MKRLNVIIHNDWDVKHEFCSVCKRNTVDTIFGMIKNDYVCLNCLRKLGISISDPFDYNLEPDYELLRKLMEGTE